MDWKSLTSKLDPYIEKMDPYLEKAKDAGYKALDFTQKQLQNTPIVLKTQAEYELLRTSKRLIIIAYDQTYIDAREIILRSPVWAARAWSDATELRFLEVSSAPDLVMTLGITTPLDMRVWYLGQETYHATDLPGIKSWWGTRIYDGTGVSASPAPATPPVPKSETAETPVELIDPLAGK